jgi:molybdopterin-biosynthesis enzyme MoeA-like protein
MELIASRGFELNEARLKMAKMPIGAKLIENSVSRAPGFRIDNVFVLAGIPAIAQAMFDAIAADLTHGQEIHSASVDVLLKESDIAAPLEQLARQNPTVEIGSYPFTRNGIYGANLVVRGTDRATVNRVVEEIETAMRNAGGETLEPIKA